MVTKYHTSITKKVKTGLLKQKNLQILMYSKVFNS